MKLKDYFQKPIDRSIETVIKADDQDHIFIEVDEYIVTDEIAKKIADFFALYNTDSLVNGAWISGFFGSGKSHLLKILSYVLENREHDGMYLGKLFSEKIVHDQMLRADVERAIQIPSDSILFNIDQQAQITSKKEDDAVLHVFYKVFYDYLGFFGSKRHVAEFELWLTEENKYQEFKQAYEQEANESWYEGRRKYFTPKTKRAVAKILAQLMGGNADEYANVMDDLQKNHSISPDDFGQRVAKYIKSKGKDFRLNFFVDEVGQFIADNTKLMLSLQTIAETLATKCEGRSWILVTSQEDLEMVVGDDTKSQSDDFSKIQGRFRARIPLTSANVDEVIEKRLLAKTEWAQTDLKHFYQAEKANLETLISFSENGVQFRKYRDDADFISKYPFLPYQFDLFQQCIKELSKHNVFQGKHHSVGERSMLGVFQEVLKSEANKEDKILITFDQMFEGLRSVIKGEVINSITMSEKNVLNELSRKVLKTLFMVKYYINFKATAQNIAVLMLDKVHTNFKEHNENIRKALDQLENETYIRRNGELYEFLTDDEKDIENEIKDVSIDESEIIQLYNDLIYGGILSGMTKIKYLDNKQDYDFSKKINGTLLSTEKELSIDIITPDFQHDNSTDHFKGQTMGMQTLMMMVLPEDNHLLQEIRMYKKTDKYIPQQQNSGNSESVKRILSEKGIENRERRRKLIMLLNKMLGEATVYLNGEAQIMANTNDGKTKVVNAFQDLVKLAFPRLNLIGNIVYSEDTIRTAMQTQTDKLFDEIGASLSAAEQEILDYISRRKNQADRTTLNDVKDYFAKKPYGWYQTASFTLVARLFKRGKIEARQDANFLTEQELLSNLLNNRAFANTLLEALTDIEANKIHRLKDIYFELFDETCSVKDARDVATQFTEKAKAELNELNQLVGAKEHYPFLNKLKPFIELLERVSTMDYRYVFSKMDEYEDELLDAKENILDPIRKFWIGEQKGIYDEVLAILKSDQSNLEYIDFEDLELLRALPQHTEPYLGNVMREAKGAMEALRNRLNEQLGYEREESLKNIRTQISKIEKRDDFKQLDDQQKREILEDLNAMVSRVYAQHYIAQIRQYKAEANNKFTDALNKIQELRTPKDSTVHAPQVRYIKRNDVQINFEKSELRNQADVEAYVQAVREALLKQLDENKRISL